MRYLNICDNNLETASKCDCRICSSNCSARREEMSLMERLMLILFCIAIGMISIYRIVGIAKWIF